MMTENNNLLYHPGDGGFDRLEEMEGGTLARIPVLRSVPGPMHRPWATRGAITLLLVCGVVFGVIAIASMNNGSASASAAETASGPTNANAGGVTIVSGSSSFAADSGVSGSASTADNGASGSTTEFALGSSAADKSESSSNDSSNKASSGGSGVLAGVHAEESTSGSNGSRSGSSFEEVMIDPLDISIGDSQLGSFAGSASDVPESESASESSEQEFLVSGSDSADGSSEWLFDSVSGSQDFSLESSVFGSQDSASDADWHSSSADDETSDSLSRSEDGSLES